MSYENVKAYFKKINMQDHIVEHDQTCDTVEHAAQMIGVSNGEIAKTLSFLVGDQPILVVMAGDTRVNSSKFKKYFHQKPGMIPRDQVNEMIGHEPGGVCPFAIHDHVPVYLDESLKRFDVVHAAAGIDYATATLTLDELAFCANTNEWVDICKIIEEDHNDNA